MSGRSEAVRVGEVIEASTTEFVAQSYVLHEAPAFGQLVRAGEGKVEIFAVTSIARTGSIDPGRRPVARGRDESDEEDVYRHNPELPEILRTEFTAAIVGFRGPDGACQHRLPPRPPRLHGFVYVCSPAEVVEFTTRLEFLQTLAGAAGKAPAAELVAACVRGAGEARGRDRSFLVRAGKELAILYGADLNRLSAILRRIRV